LNRKAAGNRGFSSLREIENLELRIERCSSAEASPNTKAAISRGFVFLIENGPPAISQFSILNFQFRAAESGEESIDSGATSSRWIARLVPGSMSGRRHGASTFSDRLPC
jgi:hypothetical protein